jgi:hypothetical protein
MFKRRAELFGQTAMCDKDETYHVLFAISLLAPRKTDLPHGRAPIMPDHNPMTSKKRQRQHQLHRHV